MFDKLFETARIGDLTLKNRLVMPPMASGLADDEGMIAERQIGYYVARARGGVGLVTVEVAAVHPDWTFTYGRQTRVDDDRCIPGLARLAEAIHAGGAGANLQIGHPGASGHHRHDPNILPVSPAGVQFFADRPAPRALSRDEIAWLIEAFGRAARRAQVAGFDAVEIHAAHGYLLSQFLAPSCNRREDEYGGDLRGRAKIVLDALAAVRRECGQSYPIFVRVNGQDEEGGIVPEDTAIVARMLEEMGANAISVSYGSNRAHSPKGMAPAQYPEGLLLHLATQVKQSVSIPVMGVGRITTPAFAEKALKEGRADLLALGRTLIADPEWPNKAASGREDEIVPCLACNRCSQSTREGERFLACTVNPAVGKEAQFAITAAPHKKKVVVVGGGPGGMEAARTAARRGHEVALYEKAGELGGQLIVASKPPYKEEVGRLNSYYARQMAKCGVRLELGRAFTATTAEQVKPDAVILATGVTPVIPDIPGVNRPNVVSAEEVLAGRPVGDRVVIVGGQSTGCETAEFLAGQGKTVTVVRRGERLATDLQASVRALLMRRLRAAGVAMRTGVRAYEEITEKGLVLLDGEGQRQELPADTIVLAAGVRQNDSLRLELEGKVPALYAVGDCVEPRDIMAAVREGAIAGHKA